MQTRVYSFSEDISYMYCKDIGQCPYKRMSTVQDTIQLQANTVQHLHYTLSCCLYHSVRLLQAFLVARWKLSAETSNTSRYQYLLGFVLKKIWFWSFVRESWRDLDHIYVWIYTRFVALAGDLAFLKTKVQTIDCLQACRFDLYYRICMVGPEKSRQRAMAKPTAISLACWFCSHAHLIGFCVCITAVCMAAALGG